MGLIQSIFTADLEVEVEVEVEIAIEVAEVSSLQLSENLLSALCL